MTKKVTRLNKATDLIKQAEESLQAKNEGYTVLNEKLNSTVEELQAATEELRVQNEELQQTEEVLRESKTRYQMLFNSSLDAIAVLGGTPPKLLFVNPAFLRLFGYSSEEILAFSADDIFLLVHPEDREIVKRRLHDRFRQEDPPNKYEFRIVTKDSQVRWVEVSASSFSIGSQLFSQAIYHDITVRKQAEETIRESERRYRLLVETANEGIFVAQGVSLKFVNPMVLELTGRTKEELMSIPFLELVHHDDRELVRNNHIKRVKGEAVEPRYHLRILKKDKSIIWIEMSGVKIEWEGQLATINFVTDITARKQAEDSLRESDNRYRMLVENASDIAYRTDENGYFTFVNPAFFRIIGYRENEIVGKHYKMVIRPDKFKEAITFFANQLVKKIQNTYYEFPIITKDGHEKWLGQNMQLIMKGDHVTGFQAVARDITERKQIETQNRQLQKTESLGRMAAAIAHHFNNQLGVVIGNLEIAMNELPKEVSAHKTLTAAMQSAWKSADMSGLMLTYLGQSYDKVEPLDLSYSCRKILPILKASMPENVILETDFSYAGPVIKTNPDYMQQILTNLLTNAWETVGKNSGTISLGVKTVSPTEISTVHRFPIDWQSPDNTYACLEVTDTGSGIEDKDIEKLFDPFFSTKFTGRGMGLAVVLGIVKTHNGVLTVESKPKHGSTFRVFFPLSEEAPQQTRKSVSKDDSLISPVTSMKVEEGGMVLVVEDEEMLRDMVVAMLESLGFSSLNAKDGVEALDVFGKHQSEIKFVLTDLTMPRMNGWDTLTALRKLQPDIPVILASGYDLAHVMEGDHPELPQAFLAKPYNLKALRSAISQAMSNEKK